MVETADVTGRKQYEIAEKHGFSGSFNYRRASSYLIDSEDSMMRTSDIGGIDASVSERLSRKMELSFSIERLSNKQLAEADKSLESIRIANAFLRKNPRTPRSSLAISFSLTLFFLSDLRLKETKAYAGPFKPKPRIYRVRRLCLEKSINLVLSFVIESKH